MNFLKHIAWFVLVILISACGGGGGDPKSTATTATTTTVAAPSMTLFIYDASGAKVYAVATGAVFTARAVVVDANGLPVANKLVNFSSGSFTNLTLSQASVPTNSSGIAEITVSPSVNSTGGGVSLTASALVDTKAVTSQVDFSVTGNSTPTAVVAVSDFVLQLNKNAINNSGSDAAALTVTALDANRNVMAGAQVVVVADQNGIFTPSGSSATSSSGVYSGSLSGGSDKTDRDITLTVTINGIIKRTKVRVEGSRLSIQAAPLAPVPGQSVTFTATLLDSSGNPIVGADVALTGSAFSLLGQKLTTDTKGVVKTTVTAPSAVGNYTVSASGSGVSSSDLSVSVFSSAVPIALNPGNATPSLSASPNVLSVNSVGTSANKSTLRFLFLDSTNTPIKNARVRFDDLTTGLAKVGASISSNKETSTTDIFGTVTVKTTYDKLYTDGSGVVSVQYTSGQNSSSTNGISLRACYSLVDFVSDQDCPNTPVFVNLTVSGQALSVSVGDDNLLSVGTGGTYIKKFVVTVADSAGRAVTNAPVAIAVDLTHYGKGAASSNYYSEAGVLLKDSGLTVVPSTADLLKSYPQSALTDPLDTARVQRIWCPNEDTNRNGNVDGSENINNSQDSNKQPTLEPRKSDLIVSYFDPAVTTTNSSGVLVIKVEYSQRFGSWLAYRLNVTTNVAGSQGLAERLFVTDILQADVINGSFLTPPYGSATSCVNPN
jgi:Bacterial Ig-like domain (group 1)/Invasin, domain 3